MNLILSYQITNSFFIINNLYNNNNILSIIQMGCAINPGSVDKKNKIQIHQSALSECGHAFSVGSFQSINSDHSDTFEMKEKFYNLIESGNL